MIVLQSWTQKKMNRKEKNNPKICYDCLHIFKFWLKFHTFESDEISCRLFKGPKATCTVPEENNRKKIENVVQAILVWKDMRICYNVN